jgi:indole-3-glycerol phosphate synthase
MDILTKIIEAKRERVASAKTTKSDDLLRKEAQDRRRLSKPHSLLNALNHSQRLSVIAEFKRRSPSKGMIRADANPATIARTYEAGGAVAVSVLTEQDYFAGSLDDLRAVRAAVTLPILRKDFIFDEYQVYEAAAAGADALLLIVAVLDDATLLRLRQLAEEELRMDALVEVHTSGELQRAVTCGAKLIGVNNRDLHSFNVSLETSIELARNAPPDVLLISESGLNTSADLLRLQPHGYRGFLIGETLMRAERPDSKLTELISGLALE